MQRLAPEQLFPILAWGRNYRLSTFASDLNAAVVITVMLITQSMAYGLLAGLPPQTGLYASILPLMCYALFGSSGALSVGPFAITSIMTAAALNSAFPDKSDMAAILHGAALLALLSGCFLLLFGLFRLGFLSNFISSPVISGFITASAITIAASQVGNLLGGNITLGDIAESGGSMSRVINQVNPYTATISVLAMLLLYIIPKIIKALVIYLRGSPVLAELLGKTAPIPVLVVSGLCVAWFRLDTQGVAIVGAIPEGLPHLALELFHSSHDWNNLVLPDLAISAALISLITFVSSVSAAQSFAAQKRRRVEPDQEAVGLGVANIAASLSGSFPVSGSLSRSAINFKAGSETPASGLFTALGVAVATLYLTPWFYYLPIAALTAMIIMAVLSLVDFDAIRRCWNYSKKDFYALLITLVVTLVGGVESGLSAGVVLSVVLHLYRSSVPHTAVLGLIPGTEHFRNVLRYDVITHPDVVVLRIDSSLYFANCRFLEDKVNDLVATYPDARHLLLVCSAINDIDVSALESLYTIQQCLLDAGITLHLSEIKGPVQDKLRRSHFLEHLSGEVYLTNYAAWTMLASRPVGDDYII
ncbi:MAG: sodium-independent anion transporter [Proteobacteria bacterium]|nr:MAG: sodium-independent anion transporter [Pseudomonadota bacterium]PIE40311.1 MAG: sodium-independent anion transporter [Gammaproteobacteria bacterium]